MTKSQIQTWTYQRIIEVYLPRPRPLVTRKCQGIIWFIKVSRTYALAYQFITIYKSYIWMINFDLLELLRSCVSGCMVIGQIRIELTHR